MSFKVAISDVLIANEALAMIPQEPIVSMSEQSLEARECQRWYKPVVAELLEKHHWGLATKRVALAAISNIRAGEWAYSYAKPADMAFPVKMGGSYGSFSGWTYADGLYLLGGRPMFLHVGGALFSSVPVAVLEYTSFDITEADFTNLFKRVVVIELAARICMAISKSETRTKLLMQLSEGERQRTIANDLNRSQLTYGNAPTESMLARGVGFDGGWGLSGHPLDPVADPIGATIVPDGAPPGDFFYEG